MNIASLLILGVAWSDIRWRAGAILTMIGMSLWLGYAGSADHPENGLLMVHMRLKSKF